MRRGDIIRVVAPGDYGKPRPAVVIQSDQLPPTDSVMVCLMTSDQRLTPFYRLAITPKESNGLTAETDVMVDKIFTVPRRKVGGAIGVLDDTEMLTLTRMLAVLMGFADVQRTTP